MTNLDIFNPEQNRVYEAHRRIDYLLEQEYHRAASADEPSEIGSAIIAVQRANLSACEESITDIGDVDFDGDLAYWLANAFAEYASYPSQVAA